MKNKRGRTLRRMIQRGQEKFQKRYKSFNEEYPGVLESAAEVMPDFTKMYLGYMREFFVRRKFGELPQRYFGSACSFFVFDGNNEVSSKKLKEIYWNPSDGSFTATLEDSIVIYWFAHNVREITDLGHNNYNLIVSDGGDEVYVVTIHKHDEYKS